VAVDGALYSHAAVLEHMGEHLQDAVSLNPREQEAGSTG
jgi:hypothetical protein